MKVQPQLILQGRSQRRWLLTHRGRSPSLRSPVPCRPRVRRPSVADPAAELSIARMRWCAPAGGVSKATGGGLSRPWLVVSYAAAQIWRWTACAGSAQQPSMDLPPCRWSSPQIYLPLQHLPPERRWRLQGAYRQLGHPSEDVCWMGQESDAEVAAAAAAAAAAMNHPLFGGEVDPLFYSNCCEFASVNATFLRYVCVYVSPSVGLSTAVSKHTLDDLRAASSRRPSLPSPANRTCTHE